MKLRKILKSMFNNYCKTFKDVPPGVLAPLFPDRGCILS
ncbi:stress response protein AzuC [Escherichia coli]|nr:stress response protein AzuC [Escherichia coli]